MNQFVDTNLVEALLSQLDVDYRKLNLKNGHLYFCTLSNKITFNLRLEGDGTVTLWRFIGCIQSLQGGTQVEYRKRKMTVGLEVTDEGDLSFYVKNHFKTGNMDVGKQLKKMLSIYADVITHIEREQIL